MLTTGSLQHWELEALVSGLRERGWVEGRNLVLDVRSSDGNFAQLKVLAADLARTANVIVTATTPPTRAAMDTTREVPIVFAGVGDPVSLGFVASLPARKAT